MAWPGPGAHPRGKKEVGLGGNHSQDRGCCSPGECRACGAVWRKWCIILQCGKGNNSHSRRAGAILERCCCCCQASSAFPVFQREKQERLEWEMGLSGSDRSSWRGSKISGVMGSAVSIAECVCVVALEHRPGTRKKHSFPSSPLFFHFVFGVLSGSLL